MEMKLAEVMAKYGPTTSISDDLYPLTIAFAVITLGNKGNQSAFWGRSMKLSTIGL